MSNTELFFLRRAVWRLLHFKLDGAFRDLEYVLPPNPKIARTRGLACYRRRDYEGTIAPCDEAIRLNPNHAPAYGHRGAARGDTADYDGKLLTILK